MMKLKNKDNIFKGEKDYTIKDRIFKNATRQNDNEYTVSISAWDLAEMWDKEELVYFPDSQRGTRIRKVGNQLREEAIVKKQNIYDIQSLILNGEYFTEQMTLNVLKNEHEELIYDEDTKELLITGVFTALDGNHRIRASYRAYQVANILNDEEKMNNVKNTIFSVKITHFDLVKAKITFSQLSKGLKISISRSESFDMTKSSNRIVDKLNKQSIIKGLIDTKKNVVTKVNDHNLISFVTLNMIMKENFPTIEDEKTEKEIYDFLGIFFEELVKIFPEMVNGEKRVQLSSQYLNCEPIMFWGYLNIAQELFLKRRSKYWKEEMKALGKIDFDKDNSIWSCIVSESGGKYKVINNKDSRALMIRTLKEQYYLNQG